MKENKKEDLQSRRQFFRHAAKAALPIIGAIALSQISGIAKAAQSSSERTCGYCQYSCTACVGGCMDRCARSCSACAFGCAHSAK